MIEEKILYLDEIKKKTTLSLIQFAEGLQIENANIYLRQDLIFEILKKTFQKNIEVIASGVLEVYPEGFGYLRSVENSFLPGHSDIYVAESFIKKIGLRTGDNIEGPIKAPREGERYFWIYFIKKVNYVLTSELRNRVNFDNLTPIFPNKKLKLENSDLKNNNLTNRLIDLISPIGTGQRALIIAPPRTGKTVLLKGIAQAIRKNNPEVFLMVFLIDERPEEVTDMVRSVDAEVVSSTFDEPPIRHIQVAEMVLERAKRLAEMKRDVVIILDSITRLARAYNTVAPSSGKVLSGGVEANALQKPKKFFGSGRSLEEGGSLTIVASALTETNSKMDEVIFEEFKGTGNCEIFLDRKLSEKRVFPAIEIGKSGTRNEDLLIDSMDLVRIRALRNVALGGNSNATEFLLEKISGTKNNEEFISFIGQHSR